MNLSVLIATYKRKELLERCLSYLLNKSYCKPNEIVVVVWYKDGSDDVVKRHQAKYLFIIMIEVENKSLGHSQNKGLVHCSGNIIATLDDDAFVYPDWVNMVKLAHKEHPEAGCIGGRIINIFPNNLIARLESHSSMPYDKEIRIIY